MEDNKRQELATAVVVLSAYCHAQAREMGWWNKTRPVPECLMLMVSEIAEAMEGDRKNADDDHLPHRKMFVVELADLMIRTLDLAGGLGLTVELAEALVEKLEYNKQRADHQLENRGKEGGKKY